jgi:uncharacterized protein YjgD (DUF1641 family)
MATPIELDLSPRNVKAELLDRLERAPAEHAEALLSGYEVVQGLHDAGILDLTRGLLFSGNKVLEEVVDAANKPGSIRALRNLIILIKIAESIDPEALERISDAVPKVVNAVYSTHKQKPPSVWQSIRIATGANVRRGLAAINAALGILHESVEDTKIPRATNG